MMAGIAGSPVYDVLIVGGGMVGASLACALGSLPLRTGLVEAVPFSSDSQPSYDDRSIALAWGGRRIFEGMGLWPEMAEGATAIRKIHVSDRGHFGMTRLDARRHGHEAFGYVIGNRTLGQVFASVLPDTANLEVFCPASLVDMTLSEEMALVTIRDKAGRKKELQARLVVGADGGRSLVRRQAGIDAYSHDYRQTAIISNVTSEKGHDGIAYERFTGSGPLALLPMSEGRCSLVWTVYREQVGELMALDEAAFLVRLERAFGRRLGRFTKTGRRHAYPLHLVRADTPRQPRLALIGNAAHTLHPVAGQGFNLGIRDVAVLAQCISDAVAGSQDPGSRSVLTAYEQWRKHDQGKVIMLTDSLVRLFSNNYAPLVVARNLGLLALDVLPPLKGQLIRQTMGLSGKLPRLARGLPLVAPS